jgi:hypothetical protein
VTGTVDMSVMARLRLVFYVGGVDGDTTGPFFGGLVNLSVASELGTARFRKNSGDGSSQGRLSVIDVTWTTCKRLYNSYSATYVPIVPMFIWGLLRENLVASAYPLAETIAEVKRQIQNRELAYLSRS